MTTEQISVLLVDDDVFARSGLRSFIEDEAAFTVAGEASDCEGALQITAAVPVDVIVTRANPNKPACVELLRQLRRQASGIAVVALGRSGREEDALRLVRAGADAYLDRDASPEEVVDAVRTVAAGGHVIGQRALSGVVRDYVALCDQEPKAGLKLTPRERQILTLVAEGFSSREIATDLAISHKTVEAHRQHIMGKADLHNIADLVRYGLREGLVSVG